MKEDDRRPHVRRLPVIRLRHVQPQSAIADGFVNVLLANRLRGECRLLKTDNGGEDQSRQKETHRAVSGNRWAGKIESFRDGIVLSPNTRHSKTPRQVKRESARDCGPMWTQPVERVSWQGRPPLRGIAGSFQAHRAGPMSAQGAALANESRQELTPSGAAQTSETLASPRWGFLLCDGRDPGLRPGLA
jgi:hypothetical protein